MGEMLDNIWRGLARLYDLKASPFVKGQPWATSEVIYSIEKAALSNDRQALILLMYLFREARKGVPQERWFEELGLLWSDDNE